ncbi:hypothetical protein [Tamlana sp. I1]|uniref:hypothetical protein n=1 Tax=Tamlana sp. I1 TaxID=2762061 RepID=UPI00188F894A|nr:hypothetical protein [Tamlana sp. I1]
MKCILSVTFFMLFGLNLIGQTKIFSTTEYKTGIYKTYQEFLNNSPSIPFDYEFKEKNMKYGLFGFGGSVPVNYVKVKNKKGKEIGHVFGFSDGKKVFINPGSPILSSNARFYNCQFIYNFCYFKYLSTLTTSVGSQSSSSHSLGQGLIDMENNKAVELDKDSLRELISSDKELLAAFEAESNKNTTLFDYFKKFLNRQQADQEVTP